MSHGPSAQAAATPPGPAIATGGQVQGSGASEWWSLHGHLPQTKVAAVPTVLLVMLLVAFGIAVGRLRKRMRRADGSAGETVPVLAKAACLRALRRACAEDDRHAAKTALLDLAQLQWHDDPPRGLGALASRLGQGAAEVRSLERSLYAVEAGTPWRGDALWQATRRGLAPSRDNALPDDDVLGSLYPSTARTHPA
jgi:hypothetical protein